ncbi:hypothetical protein RND81_02G249800 [Saponaria officinalis]|uniref:Cysteine-rich transmembrane CYSTM domain-containing protein n=1 Tax=Saponaria officinalis TaxID=3572 RepID=A0AAW1MU80_SAPOF
MSYSQVSHVAHDSYPPLGPGPGPAPPPPPPAAPAYQGYFRRQEYPGGIPHQTQMHNPFQSSSYEYPYDNYYNNPCSSLLRTCMAALCCCCVMEECCPPLSRW